MSLFKLALRVLLVAMMAGYFVIAGALLVTRYYVLPRVDQWRPNIEQALSEAVGTPVRFDAITADWQGLNANLKISNLQILDEEGVAQLGVPETRAILSWRSLLALEPVFRYISVEDVIVVARRAPDGAVYVAGFEVQPGSSETNFWQSETMRWLLTQGRLNIEDSRLVWVDQQDGSVPLVFEDIDVTADNGLLGHQLDLRLTLPPQLGGRVEAVASIEAVAGPVYKLLVNEPDGYLYLSVSELYPQRLTPWLDVKGVNGSFAGRVWLDIQAGKFTNFTLSMAGRDAVFEAVDSQDEVHLEEFRWRANGPLAMLGFDKTLPDFVQSMGSLQRVSNSLTVANADIHMPSSGLSPIALRQVSAEMSLSRSGADSLKIDLQDLALTNDDGLMTARGSWQLDETSAPKSGMLDIEGTLARFDLPKLHHYLPNTMDPQAKQWLTTAFLSGSVPRATFVVKGALDDFPYGTPEAPGTFELKGKVQDVGIDYANQDEEQALPWPLLTNLVGELNWVNDRIALDVSAGALTLPNQQRITLSNLSAQVTDLVQDPVVTINGTTEAQAEDYLALFDDTALRDIVPAFVRDFSGKGDWSMPLSLRVPIDDLEQTSFEGKLSLNGGEMGFAGSPALTNVQGLAVLSEKGFDARGLTAKLLGGDVSIDGGINGTLDKVQVTGKLMWGELAAYAKADALSSIVRGDLSYDLTAKVSEDTFAVTVQSDLVGTTISLPAPLGLSGVRPAPTSLTWQGHLDGKQADTWRLSVANRVSMSATSAFNAKPFFSGMQVAIGSAKPLSGPGLTVAANVPNVNVDDWISVINGMGGGSGGGTSGQSTVMPQLARAQLNTKQLVMGTNHLDNVAAELNVTNARQYKVSLASAQTNGQVHWALDQGKLQNGFLIRLDRLEIGNRDKAPDTDKQSAKADLPALPKPGALSSIPELDIEVKDVSIYGARLGTIKVKGRNSPDGKQWQISELRVSNPYAEMSATGNCRFSDSPGITLDAKLEISDLGEMTKYLGQGNRVRGGRGTVDANVKWSNFPWRFDYAGLSGRSEVKLQEGIFDHVNSRSARVLELLSMQSLNRLFSANLNADESFEKGFPWASIDGQFDIKQGVVDIEDLVIKSPVATISLTGDSSLVDETWGLSAVVRPNLDMSGTALATGFLVNPIFGLSALVGQYLLRNPVESALSQRFTVGGTWSDPLVSGLGDSPSSEDTDKKAPTPEPQSSNTVSGATQKESPTFDTSDLVSGN